MKGKTKFSKLLALVVCLMLITTMFSTYSFAITEDDTFSFKVNGLEPGVTVNAYQITNVNQHLICLIILIKSKLPVYAVPAQWFNF